MYLIYAEATIGNNASTTDATAVEYFNKVHTRAGLPAYEVGGPQGSGPLTLETIQRERFKEFAMEGMSWYDLVSIHYYDPTRAYSILNSQDRGLYSMTVDQMPNPTEWTFIKTSYFTERTINASSANFQLPIPNVELAQAPNLNRPPVDYP